LLGFIKTEDFVNYKYKKEYDLGNLVDYGTNVDANKV
jgi:hypothetical protein